jgi:hypothetical protein
MYRLDGEAEMKCDGPRLTRPPESAKSYKDKSRGIVADAIGLWSERSSPSGESRVGREC